MTNGAVGGESGWEAALLSFRFAVETPAALEDGEKMKNRKPIASKPAKINVMELVRRNGLGKAIMMGIDRATKFGENLLKAPAPYQQALDGVYFGYLIKILEPCP